MIGERFEVDDDVDDKSSFDSFGLFRPITDMIPWLVFRNLSFGSFIPQSFSRIPKVLPASERRFSCFNELARDTWMGGARTFEFLSKPPNVSARFGAVVDKLGLRLSWWGCMSESYSNVVKELARNKNQLFSKRKLHKILL